MNEASEDLISLSPAAAAAYSLLKSGKSLTAIYSEHCRLISELEKKTAENQQIERYVTELIEVCPSQIIVLLDVDFLI